MMTEGYISKLKCTACAREFPTFVFVADTDMATSGLMALTGLRSHDIVLLQQTQIEPDLQCERRVTKRLGEIYKLVPLIRSESRHQPSADFQTFLKNYKPPQLFYQCIHCGGEAAEMAEETKEVFTAAHRIMVLDD